MSSRAFVTASSGVSAWSMSDAGYWLAVLSTELPAANMLCDAYGSVFAGQLQYRLGMDTRAVQIMECELRGNEVELGSGEFCR